VAELADLRTKQRYSDAAKERERMLPRQAEMNRIVVVWEELFGAESLEGVTVRGGENHDCAYCRIE
jgi:hypothetical protein